MKSSKRRLGEDSGRGSTAGWNLVELECAEKRRHCLHGRPKPVAKPKVDVVLSFPS